LKVMTVVGTRPEVIRLSETIRLLDQVCDHVLVHTGQNYDERLNDIFFKGLGIRSPDHFLNAPTATLGQFMGGVLSSVEELVHRERPDAFLVLGDTNSAIGLIIAKRLKVATYHMEAGNRSFDANVPEEINRRLVDHVADFNLVYSEHARRNLLAEGIEPRRILLTGSPLRQVLRRQSPLIDSSNVLSSLGVTTGKYMLASIHREENVDLPSRLESVLDCFDRVVQEFEYPIIVSTHPRTRQRLQALGREVVGVSFHPPMGFHDYARLQRDSFCVLSDSGTISEEASILDFRAVTMRDAIERPEALDAGSILMSGLDPENLVECIRFVRSLPTARSVPHEYQVDDFAERSVAFIMSTYRRNATWGGVRTS
jgi:UDP-N-acetylglucosamine 2-epimerase